MEVGVVGKPNVGKSTLFNALTLLDVPMAPFPFTTIKPHRGVSAVRFPCPHREIGKECTPGNAACRGGIRWVPVSLIDVPGLVPGAHEGRGLGHQFLDELRAASGFLQVVDASGSTTSEGVLGERGSTDPATEVAWLEDELVAWIQGILSRDFDRQVRKMELEELPVEEFLSQKLTGLSISPSVITQAVRNAGIDRGSPGRWGKAELQSLARALLREAKPRIVAANKCDLVAPDSVAALGERVAPIPTVATSAEVELSLRRAARAGLVRYAPGDPGFDVPEPARLSSPQRAALESVRRLLELYGSTGVQKALETLVFGRLGQIVVFPVEDEHRWTDSKGRILPDALLIPAGTQARALAYRVHSELGEGFIRAVDGRTHRSLAADHPLEPGAVVRIVSRR
jgi:ribosome-binding ATPase